MTTVMQGVEVRLGRLDSDWRKTAILVSVLSKKKPGVKSRNEIDPGACENQADLLKRVGLAAGACAEYLCERYRETIDPSMAVIYGQRAFLEEMKLLSELKKDVPKKLQRLLGMKHALQNNELEFLDRCKFFVDKDMTLTADEVHALDVLLGRIHGSSL